MKNNYNLYTQKIWKTGIVSVYKKIPKSYTGKAKKHLLVGKYDYLKKEWILKKKDLAKYIINHIEMEYIPGFAKGGFVTKPIKFLIGE